MFLFNQASQQEEIDALQKESEMPIEDLLKNLPKEILEKPAKLDEPMGEGESSDSGGEETKEKKDKKKVTPLIVTFLHTFPSSASRRLACILCNMPSIMEARSYHAIHA